MDKSEKNLLIQDICSRLPFGLYKNGKCSYTILETTAPIGLVKYHITNL